MKIISYLLIMSIIFSACSQKEKYGSLSGTFKNIPDGTVISLVNLENNQVFQKVTVIDGKFYTKFNLPEPSLFGIWGDKPMYDKDRFLLWLENSKIKIEGNYEYLINSKVEGSTSNTIFLKYDSICQKFNNEYTRLRVLRSRTTDTKILDSIASASNALLSRYRETKIKFYTEQIDREVALYYLSRQTVAPDFNYYAVNVITKADIEMLYYLLPEKYKTSKKGELIKEYFLLPEIPKVGEKFVDVEQNNPEGKTTSISENLGKFTILDFWASSCGPCRMKHPVMRKLYNKYHIRGLNIIGISGDNNKDEWITAINADSIPWTNLSDLRGSNNKAFMRYGVKAIPRLFLLDENGIILDDNLAAKPLEIELDKIFKQNGL
jgi:thiol-disulfide isomerase/thioredoxin